MLVTTLLLIWMDLIYYICKDDKNVNNFFFSVKKFYDHGYIRFVR